MLLKNTQVRVQQYLLIIRLAKYSIPTSPYIQVMIEELHCGRLSRKKNLVMEA